MLSGLLTAYLLLIVLLLATLAARTVAERHAAVVGAMLGSTVRLLGGLALFLGILYLTLYFLSLVGGFYESLTCKVVTLPACEDPLALPSWLLLPAASVGGVIGILPLLGIFLAKALQGRPKAQVVAEQGEQLVAARTESQPPYAGQPQQPHAAQPPQPHASQPQQPDPAQHIPTWVASSSARAGGASAAPPKPGPWPGLFAWLGFNAGLIGILFVELWLAWLRGAAEAADRQVRLSLGLDAELPAAYLGVAQWGAVVLALGLSVVVLYLGIAGRYALGVANRGFTGLGQGAGFVSLVGALLVILASGLKTAWTTSAIVLGRLALKLQSGLTRLYTMLLIGLGRLLLKLQSGLTRVWVFAAVLIGRFVLFLSRVGSRIGARFSSGSRDAPGGGGSRTAPGGGKSADPTVRGVGANPTVRGGARGETLALLAATSLAATLAIGWLPVAHAATTYVVLQDMSGGEGSRLEGANAVLLSWADPSPQLALLGRHDRLIVVPVRAPGALDTVYSALFNAAYPSSQLDRYAFFAELRNSLPKTVDEAWGTGLSEALRSAAIYLRDADPEHDRVLVVFGNGEDHSPERITPLELGTALHGALVVMLNAGLEEMDHWRGLFASAGARAQIVYDQAATRSLTIAELKRAIERASQ